MTSHRNMIASLVSFFIHPCINCVGTKLFNFHSMKEFLTWKGREEELTYTTYIKDQSPYHPKGYDGIVITRSVMCSLLAMQKLYRCGYEILLCVVVMESIMKISNHGKLSQSMSINDQVESSMQHDIVFPVCMWMSSVIIT